MKKAIGQTVRDLKREVNKKVLKVPGIEQKVLDATSNEAWGPHGSLLADIAQATKNYHDFQMIMAVIWKRINDTGKNWRHVYKALTVLEYLVGHGSERVIEEIREHGHQISALSNFRYIDSSGRDQGNNVRKKSQSLVILVNDKERIIEVRQKAAANRDRFRNNSTGGMYKPGSDSSSGAYGDRYDDDHYGSREEDRSGYGRERELGYRDDDRYSRDGDRYGRDYEERYSRDGYRDDEYSGRSRSADDYQHGSRSRSSDRDHDPGNDDDGQHSSRAKAEDHSLEGRLEQKLSQQNMGAPPSYEEAAGESRSPLQNERDEETSAASAPKGFSPVSDNPRQTSAPTGSFPLMNDNPTEATAAAITATSGKLEVEASDEFDPRVPVSAALAGANIVEIDLFGSLSESFSSNALDIVPSASTTSNPQGNVNLDSTASFAAVPSTSNNFNQSFEDPFGDSPFKAIPSTESAPSQPQTHQSHEPSQLSHPNLEAVSILGFGESFSVVPYSTSGASDTQPLSTNSQFLSQDFSTPPQETDILADILPPAPLPGMTSQQNFSASPDSQSSLSFSASSGKMASQSFFVQSGQLMQQDFSAATSQPAPQAFPGPISQPTQSSDHMYGGFHSQAESLTPVASSLFPQSQSGYNGPINSGNYLPKGSTSTIPSHMAPQAPTGHLSQSANYFPQHGGSTAHSTSHLAYKSPADQASQFNIGIFIAQQGNAAPSAHQPLPLLNASNNAVSSTGSNSMFSQPSKEKFETKSTVWADTLSRGLVNLNISGPKINPLADIGIDFDAINRKEKRMEKPTTTAVTSTVTMGKAMGSGSGIGRTGAGALRPGVGIGMESYGGMNAQMGMGVGRGLQMQPPPPTGLPPGSNINIPGNYNNSMMGTGIGGYPQHQHPYGGGGGGHR